MKNKIGYLALLVMTVSFIFTLNLQSQTYHPTKYRMNYGVDSNIFLDKHPWLQQQKFNIGWHWAYGKMVTKVLGGTHIHIFQDDWLPDTNVQNTINNIYANNVNMIINAPVFSKHWHNLHLSGAKSLVFEPTYKVDVTNPYQSFEPRLYDTTRYALGFENIKGYISNSNNDLNYDRLQLFQDSLSNEIVLSNNWTSNEYTTIFSTKVVKVLPVPPDTVIRYIEILNNHFHDNLYEKEIPYTSTENDKMYAKDWQGVNNYLNLNLRRIDTNDVALNNDTVLSIRMPYATFSLDTMRLDSAGNWTGHIDTKIPRKRGLIRFNYVPDTNAIGNYSLPLGRGIVRDLIPRSNYTDTTIDTVIYITRNMLPAGNSLEKDITISAYFVCDDKRGFPEYNNYALNGYPKILRHNTIDSLKLEVRYYDNCNLGIDWISINNRATRELSMGMLDTMLKKKLQYSIDQHFDTIFTKKLLRPYRWYLNDEPSFISELYTRHYLTKLFGPIFTQESGIPHKQYNYFCNPKENWVPQGKFPYWRTNPYIPYHTQRYSGTVSDIKNRDFLRCNFRWQGASSYTTSDYFDTNRVKDMLSSNYETVLGDSVWNGPKLRFNHFKEQNLFPPNYGGVSNLQGVDREEYVQLLDSNLDQYLFSGIPWWGQIFSHGSYTNKGGTADKLDNGVMEWYGVRSMTGEEFRYMMKRVVFFGAKGFVVDGESTNVFPGDKAIVVNFHHDQNVVNKFGYNNLDDWTFLEKENMGGDFLNIADTNDVLAKYVNLDTLSQFMGIDTARYYVSRKSTRREFKKISEFIKSQDSLLMSLRLQASISKGFRFFYNQKYDKNNPYDTLLNKYLKIYETKTRPLNRVRPYYEQESWDNIGNSFIDSGFYNITLLKDTNQINNDSEFYLGVLNKRTGPHILLDSADCGKTDSISFITTAELDNWCDGVDSIKWRKYYWERLGTREITVFFNDSTYNPITHYLKITEVENRDTTGFSNWNFWRKNKYENILDTKLYANQPLKINLLPGDGKLLKVEKVQRQIETDTCDCDHILPQKYLEFKRKSNSECYTLDFTLYPCPNIQADSFQLDINSAIIPPCIQRFFHVTMIKNDSIFPFAFPVDLTDTSKKAFMLYTGYNSGDKKIKLKYILCPDSTSGSVTTPCTDQELTNLTVTAYFGNGYCGKTIETTTSVKLDNFNNDFNKFFQDEFTNFSIVPNPASTFIDLSFETPLSTNSKVYIVDEQGRILKERIVAADSNEKLTIDVNQLSNGTYFIAVYDKDKLIKGKPFLIIK